MAYQKTDTITHSKILAFTCPARYEKLHILGLDDDSDPARRGSTLHSANEVYIRELVKAQVTHDVDLAKASLHEAIVREGCPAHLLPDVQFLWNNHVERFDLDLEAFLAAEERQVVGELSFKPDYTYVRADGFEVHDLKSHFQALDEEGAKRDLQARMYALLASKVWPGFPVYRFVFHFVRLRHDVVATFEPAELDAIELQLEALVAAIQAAKASGAYPAAPGQQCQYCTFKCPRVDDALRMPARITTPEDAARIGADLVVLRSQALQLQRVLAQYTDLHGPVETAGHEWGHRVVERMSYPATAVIEILTKAGASLEKLSFGKTILKSFLTAKKWTHVKDQLTQIQNVKTSTQFTAKKVHLLGNDPEEEETSGEGQ